MSVELARPNSVDEAIRILSENEGDAKLIAGGTAVGLMMRQGLIAPPLLVSMDRVDGLTGIEISDGHLRIGAKVTLREIASSELIRTHAPALAHSSDVVANVRIRNVATLAGNLAEADYASDPPSVLTCLGASYTAQRIDGTRSLAVSELITGFYSTALSPTEVITEVQVPVARPGERSTYLKYVSRSSEDRPCVGVAARAVITEGVLEELNVVVGAVAATPATAPEVCNTAIGRPLDDGMIAAVASGYTDSIDPMEDVRGSSWYRTQMIGVFVTRALQQIRGAE